VFDNWFLPFYTICAIRCTCRTTNNYQSHPPLYFSKTIRVFCLVETIKVICFFTFQRLSESFVLWRLSRSSAFIFKNSQCLLSCGDYQSHLPLYFSKTIRVFCLAETIKVIYFFTIQRLSESFVLRRLSRSSAFIFKDYQCLFVLRRLSKSSAPLFFKDYQSLLSCKDNQGHMLLHFSKTIKVFCLAETI